MTTTYRASYRDPRNQPSSLFSLLKNSAREEDDLRNDSAIAQALAEDLPDTRFDKAYAKGAHQEEIEAAAQIAHHGDRRDRTISRVLSGMLPLPIQPQTNSMELPEVQEVSSERSRLLLRLDMYGLTEKTVSGDGNCQFRALADQLFRNPDQHTAVRAVVSEQLRNDPERYSAYVLSAFDEYCAHMAQDGIWGDHVTLQAAADAYGMKICILTSFLENSVIEVPPKEQREDQVLWLSFWAEVHYNSLYPAADPPHPHDGHDHKHDEHHKKLLGSRKLRSLFDHIIHPGAKEHS